MPPISTIRFVYTVVLCHYFLSSYHKRSSFAFCYHSIFFIPSDINRITHLNFSRSAISSVHDEIVVLQECLFFFSLKIVLFFTMELKTENDSCKNE